MFFPPFLGLSLRFLTFYSFPYRHFQVQTFPNISGGYVGWGRQAQVQAQGTHEREAELVQAGLHSSTFIAMICYTKAKRGVADPVMEKRKEKSF